MRARVRMGFFARDTALMDDREAQVIARLRSTYEAFNRGDFDAALAIARPDIEFVRPGGQAPVRGVAALREWMEPDAFEEQRIEPLDFRVEGDKVLVRLQARVRGAGSGIEMDIGAWSVWTFDDGRFATRLEFYL